ncbi:hypothetical protein D0812_24120 [Vibrio owensii]|uniref:DUF2541 family protein n=1 Tax=Vibrio owensii TaxID=696485 RepID=A0AAP9GGQ1_9VIBR|nr:hypothetical protein [Vibrio owensii]AYO17453.1 hypothetical protein D0812_24120 [Vibrio owensii]QGH49595.1 hypothetical protein APZ19_21110 [Vibrio owensii]
MTFNRVFSIATMTVAMLSSGYAYAASAFSADQLCKAGLALAIDKQPRGIKTAGTSGQRILLALKNGKNDWDYRCTVNRQNRTLKIDARDLKRNDKYLAQAIRYRVNEGKRSVEVTMKKRAGGGLKNDTFTTLQLD